jgi:hypothetical protein
MVKRFLLPELALLSQLLVDSKRGVMKSRIALRFHRVFRGKRCQQVHVIRHDHKITHAVSIAIEVQSRIGYDLG